MSALPPVRTVLIDDHPALRAGVRGVLEQSGRIDVVGEASDGEEGVELCVRLEPNVVLLDMEMPGMDGIAVAERLRELSVPTRVLAYSAYDDAAYVTAMLQAGAAGYGRSRRGRRPRRRPVVRQHHPAESGRDPHLRARTRRGPSDGARP